MKSIIVYICMATCLFFGGAVEGSICKVIDKIKQRSLETNSDVVLIARNGRIIVDYAAKDGHDVIESLEMSRSFVPLAYAFLLEDKKIPCLDIQVSYFLSEPFIGKHPSYTLRELMNNTSGLDKEKFSFKELLHRPLFQPGTRYYRNDNALSLLVSLVEKITGKTYQDYLFEKLFRPLGIESVGWKEVGKNGVPQLLIAAKDWLKVGNFLADNCQVNGKPLLSPSIFQQLFQPSQQFDPYFGMQWWLEYYDTAFWWDEELLKLYQQEDVVENFTAELASLQSRQLHFTGQVIGKECLRLKCQERESMVADPLFMESFVNVIRSKGLPLCRFQAGKVKTIASKGAHGQQLIVMPYGKWVAVRQKHVGSEPLTREDYFEDFPILLEQLAIEYDGWVD